MDSNLTSTPYRDVVQGALPLETGVDPLYAGTLAVQCLSSSRLTHLGSLSSVPFVASIGVNDGLGLVLPPNEVVEGSTRVTLIGGDVLGPELACGEPCFAEYVRCPSSIVDVASAYVSRDRQLVLSVNKQVKFPSQRGLCPPVGVLLDRPARFLVRFLGLAPVDPSFERGGVYGNPLSEAWESSVAVTYQSAGHVLDLGSRVVLGESCEEPGEGCLVGDGVGRRDATGPSDVRVVLEGADKRCSGLQTQDVLGNQAMPEDLDGVPLGATAGRALESIQERSIVQLGEDGLEFCDNGWRLNRSADTGIINSDHLKLNPSVRSGVVGASTPTAPPRFVSSIRLSVASVYSKWRTFVTNSSEYVTKGNPYTLFVCQSAPFGWLRGWDSNPRLRLDGQACYRYTTAQCLDGADGLALQAGRRPCFCPIKKGQTQLALSWSAFLVTVTVRSCMRRVYAYALEPQIG